MRPPKKPAEAKKSAAPKPKDTRPQRERFEEAAAAAGVDAEEFDRVMKGLTPPKKPRSRP